MTTRDHFECRISSIKMAAVLRVLVPTGGGFFSFLPGIKAATITPMKTTHMNQDLNPPKESEKTPLCDSCEGIQRNWRRAPGHAELVQGVNRKEARSHGQVTVTRYVCDRCGTTWDYENDKTNLHAGWSVVGP